MLRLVAGERQFDPLHWQLTPASEPAFTTKLSTINARSQTVFQRSLYRDLVVRQRCIVPLSGFYEWKKLGPDGKEKQPYAVALGNRGPMPMAGLWDVWKNPADGQWLRSRTIITTDADELIAPIVSGGLILPTYGI